VRGIVLMLGCVGYLLQLMAIHASPEFEPERFLILSLAGAR
jgi:hypothetical protein